MIVDASQKIYLTVKQFVSKHPWPSEAALRAYIAGAPGNGFGRAFKRVGRRILVSDQEFFSAVEHLQEKEVNGGKK